ncbi:ABC transporter permease [Antarcticibacterium arcticum]|uniref:ABC transporter permease n=1 Tax=Antarcticibacterium arcticum TaxID=2585771 RepID=A0A5B8YN04_9FLAO|nr:ABC transporter permease [Antarcticibacterium arcticum]QED38658.1 ABC transporter permease [Antarcticibacterium arcticum]
MKTISYIIQKEFRQIFRNKGMLPIIFVLPLLQLIILSNAATFDIENIKFSYVDHDRSSTSRALIENFEGSPYFDVLHSFPSHSLAYEAMEKGKTDVILEIPSNFHTRLIREQEAGVGVYINAIDGSKAGVESVYINKIISNFNRNISTTTAGFNQLQNKPLEVLNVPSFWYNNTLNYKIFMVPGILVLLVTMLTLFLSGMNIVREKEIGTLEQINVTPIKKYQFIIGKLFPFWALGLLIMTIGLLISRIIFAVPIVGSIPLIYLFTSVYLLVVLGMGLLISNYTDTQQQAMFIAWFFVVIFILMSGLFTPIESMPDWAQKITILNPIRYFVEIIRMVMLKGSGFKDILPQLSIISGYALVMNALAVWSYKKTN